MADEPTFFEEDPKEFRIKCRFVLLTYNDESLEDWSCLQFQAALKAQLDTCRYWTIGKERGARNHFHLAAESRSQFNHKIDYWAIDGTNPSDCQVNKVTGSGARSSMDRGHFYVACKYKNTHIEGLNNYQPRHDYLVVQKWVHNLWAKDKINDKDVIPCAAFYKCITPHFKNQVLLTLATQLKVAKDEAAVVRSNLLRATYSEFKQFDVATEWRGQYVHLMDRYKFLVVCGPSNLGKSRLVYSWFKKPFLIKDTISWVDYPDDCDAIIIEDVPEIWQYVESHKSMFQASGVVHVNTSPTDMYTKPIDVTQKPIVITCNEWRYSLWSRANTYYLEINENTWVAR